MRTFLGLDLGGTKCAAVTGTLDAQTPKILGKQKLPTDLSIPPQQMLSRLFSAAAQLPGGSSPAAVGISCGGPLDSVAGTILEPPNLPGWKEVPAAALASQFFHAPALLQNDANACALAEWRFGAGRGCRSMIFLTFGTGLGAGLILDGKLYTGACDLAGEVGHLRLSPFGPAGYGKCGSFEGFCSGGGLRQLGLLKAREALQRGIPVAYFPPGTAEEAVTAKTIADAAEQGDATAREVYELCGEQLGRGLAVLVDLLNPERIVIGSIFARSEALLREPMERALRLEALPMAARRCRVTAAGLGESLGDCAALACAEMALAREEEGGIPHD